MNLTSELRCATIIIPVWNAWEETVKCLNSLKPTLRLGDQVVVVDNGSTDDTERGLASFDWVTVIRNGDNLGFAKACNQGAELATNDFLVFLNNDTIMFEAWLDELLASFSDLRIAAVGPRSDNVSGYQAVEVSYRQDDFAAIREFALAWSRTHSRHVLEADRLVGFCLAVRLDAYRNVGGFDEEYVIGGMEDEDLCLKLRSEGYHLVIANGCFIHHTAHATFDANNVDWHALQARNHRRFKEKWGIDRVPSLMLLSVCLIVKDEESMLDNCLSSVREIADEVVVYDTGSTDRTIEIARSHGAKVVEGYWDDSFARARKAALEVASGKWVLSIDADEVFLCDPRQLRSMLLDWNSTIEAYLVAIENLHGAGNAPSVHTAIRLFKREACTWRHRIHEQVVAADDLSRHLETGYLSGSRLIHYGYSADIFESRNKAERNLALAKAAVDDGEVGRPYALMNLGRALESVGESDKAVEVLTEATEISEDSIVQRLAVRNLINILGRLGRFDEALEKVEYLRQISVSQIAADVAEGQLRIVMGEPEEGLGLLARVPVRGRDDEGMEYEAHMLASMRGSALAFMGRYSEAADIVLDAVRSSGVLEADIGELSWWLIKAGRQPGEIASSINQADLVAVLGRIIKQPAPLADMLVETVWLQFQDRLEPLAAGARIATKLPIARAMIWSSRLRQNGLEAGCPLVVMAQDETMHPSLRVLAAAAAYATFGDLSVVGPFHDAKSKLFGNELEDAMGQVSRIAPGLLETKRSEKPTLESLPGDHLPPPQPRGVTPRHYKVVRKVASVAVRGGVNVVGPFRSSLRYGQIGRSIVRSLIEAGITVSATDFDTGHPPTAEDWVVRDDGDYPYDVTLMVLPPEELANFVMESGVAAFEGRYMIGYWTWDYPVPSKIMETASRMIHEIWTPSLFSASVIRSITDRVVSRMGLPVSYLVRNHYRTSEFEFLCSIDYSSGFERQNPLGVIEAFTSAFPEPGSQSLLVEVNNSKLYPIEHGTIKDSVKEREDIVIIDNDSRELGRFLDGRDPRYTCFVSPHRSEGTGINIAKSMLAGIPTIVTGNSFSSEFQSKRDSFPVTFRRTEFDPGGTNFIKSGYWAEPEIGKMANLMRLVREQPSKARERGQMGTSKARPYFSTAAVAGTMRRRIELIDRSRYGA